MQIKIIDIIGSEPLTLEEVKDYARARYTGDDNFIALTLIPAVRQYFERRLDISLVEKRIRVTVEDAGANFRLPQWPIDSIELIEPADLEETNGHLNNRKGANIGVTYTTEAYVQPEVKAAMLNLCSHWFVNRDMASVPASVDNVIKLNTRVLWFI